MDTYVMDVGSSSMYVEYWLPEEYFSYKKANDANINYACIFGNYLLHSLLKKFYLNETIVVSYLLYAGFM